MELFVHYPNTIRQEKSGGLRSKVMEPSLIHGEESTQNFVIISIGTYKQRDFVLL